MSKHSTAGFSALNVASRLCNMLSRHQIVTPTPIQELAIPVALESRDLIGVAQTGTGKTLAFGIPMAQNLSYDDIGLVLAPTRELAQQICETYHKLGVSTVLVVGGASIENQVRQLRGRYSVIVATPGRLIDHMTRNTVRFNRVSIVVLDEADRMLDMGFAPAIKQILDRIPTARQTLLFSATMPKEIVELAEEYMRDPVRVETESAGSASELVDQELFYVTYDEKKTLLWELIQENPGTVLIFTRTRHGARKLAKAVRDEGHTAAEIHADRTLAQRREALQGFKTGQYRVLVATDIAARGIDVKGISLVVNYDVPENPDDYIHRIGRTGRAGSLGRAVTIAIPQQVRDIWDIENLLGQTLEVSDRSTALPKAKRPQKSATPRPPRKTTRQDHKHLPPERLETPLPPKRHHHHADEPVRRERPVEPDRRDRRERPVERAAQQAPRYNSDRPARRFSDRRQDSGKQFNQDRRQDSGKPFNQDRPPFRERRDAYNPHPERDVNNPRPDRNYNNSEPKRYSNRDDRAPHPKQRYEKAPRNYEAKPWERPQEEPPRHRDQRSRNNDSYRPRQDDRDRRFERPAPRDAAPRENFKPRSEKPSSFEPTTKKPGKKKPKVAATTAPTPAPSTRKPHRGWSGRGKPKHKPRRR